MPSNYAHYRFGAQLLKTLPPDVRRSVNRHRQLYDMGLHGPDIFFYYNPAVKTETGSLARKFHRQSGRDFFTRVCKRQRLEPSEAARAYLYGLLAHYCLDSVCHPFINTQAQQGGIGHMALETEFERHLLDKDGKRPPNTQDCSRHMKLTPAECSVAAGFYPSATAEQIGRCVRNMALCTRLLAAPNPQTRKVIAAALRITGGAYSPLLMSPEPDPACAGQLAQLDTLYAKAFRLYPVLLRQITAYLTCSVPLGEEFAPQFY